MIYRIVEIPSTDEVRLKAVGGLRLEVWRAETRVEETLFPNGIWLDSLDAVARHWVAHDHEERLIGAARMTLHPTLEENPEGYLWKRAGLTVPTPAAHFCKLVVHPNCRGSGVGRSLITARLHAAIEMGAKSIVVTASERNARILSTLGFVDVGIRATFPSRPGYLFRGMQFIVPEATTLEEPFPEKISAAL